FQLVRRGAGQGAGSAPQRSKLPGTKAPLHPPRCFPPPPLLPPDILSRVWRDCQPPPPDPATFTSLSSVKPRDVPSGPTTRAIPDPGAARDGRDERCVPRPRHRAGARRRGQGAPSPSGRETRVAAAPGSGSARGGQAEPSQHPGRVRLLGGERRGG